MPSRLKVESIFHPSDFSEDSAVAFIHALKMALVARSRLSIMHVPGDHETQWADFPGVREILERWRVLPAGSSKEAVAELGLQVAKVIGGAGRNPVKSCLRYLDKHPCDLIVLAVRQHEGRMRWHGKSVGTPLALQAGQMTLFIPHGVAGFVSPADGSVTLRTILIPVTSDPRPQPALEAAVRMIHGLELPAGTIRLLHAGKPGEMPQLKLPQLPGWTWHHETRPGTPVEVILHAATEYAADLIIMTTDGPDGFLDGLRGSTTERVLSRTHCPLVSLPVGSMLG
jgi:nucleotide-binding universal stress UspA family protein